MGHVTATILSYDSAAWAAFVRIGGAVFLLWLGAQWGRHLERERWERRERIRRMCESAHPAVRTSRRR